MPDHDNPNLSLTQYEKEHDEKLRMFAIEQAIGSAKAGFECLTLDSAAAQIYKFITNTTD